MTWRLAGPEDAVALRDLEREANHRARGLYEHLGWEPTGREQAAEWPPYPVELQLRMPESAHGR